MDFCLLIYKSCIECLLLLRWFTFFNEHFFSLLSEELNYAGFIILATTKMCTSAILTKVAINSLEHLTMKPVFLPNSFRVLFHIRETWGFLEAPGLNSKNYFKWISQFWPNIWIKMDFVIDMVLELNGIDWKKYFCEYLWMTGY